MGAPLINPDLDTAAFREQFEKTGKLKITEVLRPDFADALHECLAKQVPWSLAYYNPGERGSRVVGRLTPEQQASMTPEEMTQLEQRVLQQARDGFQYLYDAFDVLEARRQRRDSHLLLQEFLSFMGSDDLFAFIREVTGDTQFNRVDCHACRYRAGHFLREHADTSPFEQRRMAYVFYFTRNWHADYGGLTYFMNDAGEITETYVPDDNSLTLFKVPVAHGVSQIAPFAPNARHSVTGWFTRYD